MPTKKRVTKKVAKRSDVVDHSPSEASESDLISAAGPFAAALDYWLDEFAESGGDVSDAQLAAAVAAFSSIPGISNPQAFVEWLAYEANEPVEEKMVGNDEEDGAAEDENMRHKVSPIIRAGIHNNKAETRSRKPESLIELRAESIDGKRYISGYAATYNTETIIGPSGDPYSFREIIRPGAFDKAINSDPKNQSGDIIFCVDHDSGRLISRTMAGTLNLFSDQVGLGFKAELPNTSLANDTWEMVRTGNLCGNSFAFWPTQSRETIDSTNPVPRLQEILESQLFDVSTVVYPAYPGTMVSARNKTTRAGDNMENERERANIILRLYQMS